MKEILSSFFKFQKDRIQNPFFLAFTTSWIILNWKMIAFLLFSDKIIEDKFQYIQDNFEVASNMFWWPILSAICYTFGLQYFNAFLEYSTLFAVHKRANFQYNKEILEIGHKRQLAIENLKTEDAQIAYREKKSENQKVEEIEARYNSVLLELEEERKEKTQLRAEYSLRVQTQEMQSEARLKRAMDEYETLRIDFKKEIEKNKNLVERNELLNTKLSENKKITVYAFRGGPVIYESLLDGKSKYRDVVNDIQISEDKFKELLGRYKFDARVIQV